MTTLTETLRHALARHTPERVEAPDAELATRRASVALVFAGPEHDLRLCIIRRAERDGDRWSGQMAFPGGRASPEDEGSTRATAERETLEEVGLDLSGAEVLGELSELPLHRHGNPGFGILSAWVYRLGAELPELVPEPGEVARAYWVSVEGIYDERKRGELEWEVEPGRAMTFPGVEHEGALIWGLTYRLLRMVSVHLGRDGLLRPIPTFE